MIKASFLRNISELKKIINTEFTYKFLAPKSLYRGNLGINIIIEKRQHLQLGILTEIKNVVYAEEE
ncbi:MAG: hypothetical protein IKT93_04675 [Clostridia bacterium]|nr:hypothetical protein [Clostridia bacterium]